MLTEVSRVGTIYEPRFPEAPRRKLAATALTLLNDKITRQAFARGLTLIDLRLICDEDADFANPIEPSARGGAKIAGNLKVRRRRNASKLCFHRSVNTG
jgi:hypothetical protein